jgi:uncharacterized protein YlxP (DUF503 family)
MIVGVCRFSLVAPQSHSLKEKRSVVRSVKGRVRTRFRLNLAEVGGLDTWQRADLGFALVGIDRDGVNEAIDAVVGFVEAMGVAEVTDVERDLLTYGVGHMGSGDEPITSRQTASGDPDAAWIPPEWLAEEKKE